MNACTLVKTTNRNCAGRHVSSSCLEPINLPDYRTEACCSAMHASGSCPCSSTQSMQLAQPAQALTQAGVGKLQGSQEHSYLHGSWRARPAAGV